MRSVTQKVQTNIIPTEMTSLEIKEAARGLALHYKDGQLVCQSFFTPPHIGEINWVEGLETQADVFFRDIALVGTNLFHLRVVGDEPDVEKMCGDDSFFKFLRGMDSTFSKEIGRRRYFEVTTDKPVWDILVSLDKKAFFLANFASLGTDTIRLENVVIVGDRLFGLTADGKVVQGMITPDLIEAPESFLKVDFMDPVNRLGRIDLLAPVPNSKELFMVSLGNMIYQFDIWGEMMRFETLDEDVKRINSIEFNGRRSIVATDEGIFELGVQEMPNMIQATSLPRQIAHPALKEGFKIAHYVDDPFVLGIHPAVGIFAKTENEKVLCF